MTDEEKIEQAARHYATGTALIDFRNGIHWRDENPSEKTLGLVEALKKIADPRLRDHSEPDKYTECACLMNMADEALAEWEKK